jgi:hypothetical protein
MRQTHHTTGEQSGSVRVGFSHDMRAMKFLRDRLAAGVVQGSLVDEQVEAKRLQRGSVDEAKVELCSATTS